MSKRKADDRERITSNYSAFDAYVNSSKRIKVHAESKEYVSEEVTSDPKRQSLHPLPCVIKDKEKDEDFVKRLEDSRLFWDLPVVPYYLESECSTCEVGERKVKGKAGESYRARKFALVHDVTKLLAYHLDCEDNSFSKTYTCSSCPDRYNKKRKLRKKGRRNQENHFKHLLTEHSIEVDQFLLNQKLIPICSKDSCKQDWLDKLIEDMIFQGDSYPILKMRKSSPPRAPPSPRSPICLDWLMITDPHAMHFTF